MIKLHGGKIFTGSTVPLAMVKKNSTATRMMTRDPFAVANLVMIVRQIALRLQFFVWLSQHPLREVVAVQSVYKHAWHKSDTEAGSAWYGIGMIRSKFAEKWRLRKQICNNVASIFVDTDMIDRRIRLHYTVYKTPPIRPRLMAFYKCALIWFDLIIAWTCLKCLPCVLVFSWTTL